LAVLVDHFGGLVNHYRRHRRSPRHPGRWHRHTGRTQSTTGLGACDLTIGGMTAKIGLAAMMAVGEPRRDGDVHELPQESDPP
jgi:hypothetical protein